MTFGPRGAIYPTLITLATLLLGVPSPLLGQDTTLERYSPPSGSRINVPGSGQVILSLPGAVSDPSARVSVSILPFWTTGAEQIGVTFHASMDPATDLQTTVRRGDPVVLDATSVPAGAVAWGHLSVADTIFALVLERGAPPLMVTAGGTAGQLTTTPAGLGQVRLDVAEHRDYGDEATFSLSRFTAVTGVHSVSVALWGSSTGECEQARPQTPDGSDPSSATVSLDGSTVTLCLDAPALHEGVEYEGEILTSIGGNEFPAISLRLDRDAYSRTATLAAPEPRTVEVQCWWPFGCSPSDVLVDLVPEPLDSRVVGVSARSRAAPTAAFDASTDLALTLLTSTGADSSSGSLWRIDPSQASDIERRTIEAQSQAQLRIEFPNRIPPGDHAAKIQLVALNANLEESPDLDLSVVVRLVPIYAVLVLILAVIFSYMATKGVGTLNARESLKRRIRAIRGNRWFYRSGWAALPMVEAEASVTLVEAMLETENGLVKSIVVPQVQASRIAAVETRLPSIEKLNRLASFWRLAPREGAVSEAPDMVVRRAQKVLRGIVDDLSRDEETARVAASLAQLEKWEDSAALKDLYWQDLRGDIRKLSEEFRIDRFTLAQTDVDLLGQVLTGLLKGATKAKDQAAARLLEQALEALEAVAEAGSASLRKALDELQKESGSPLEEDALAALRSIESSDRELVRALLEQLKPEEQPSSVPAAVVREEAYSKLKLIWEQLGEPTLLEQLLTLLRRDLDVETFYGCVDSWTWAKLEASSEAAEANVEVVHTSRRPGRNAEVYELISLEIRPPSGANNYLFKHGLEYHWTFDFGGISLSPVTRGPRVTQFAPVASSSVKISAQMRWNEKSLESPTLELAVDPQTKIPVLSAYRVPDVFVTLLALVVAVVSGMQTDAFDRALAGSFWSLGTLFAWGIGTDQVKNLLTTVTTYSGQADQHEG